MKMQANSLSPKWPEQRGRGLHFVRSAINSALVEAPLGVGYRLQLWVIQILIQEKDLVNKNEKCVSKIN